MRDVSRFYSSSHDRFTYGSSFINFNLPQFYQIVNVDGRSQVIPFRTQAVTPAVPASQTLPRCCSSISPDSFCPVCSAPPGKTDSTKTHVFACLRGRRLFQQIPERFAATVTHPFALFQIEMIATLFGGQPDW